jgi:TPR repeat protein
VCYENGNGVDRNMDKAIKYYKLSADQGYEKNNIYLDFVMKMDKVFIGT